MTDREFPSRSLGSTSDLVVLAPWKPGIVHADDLISYQTRLALTFQTLFEIRRIAREAGSIPLLSDPIERLEQIHSFRIRANRDGMLLAVTYDHHWEPYMRALNNEAGEFLDLLLCNCDNYIPARDTRDDVPLWARWIRKYERPSDYFYAATPLTVADLSALTQIERLQREDGNPVAADRELAGRPSLSAVEVIGQARSKAPSAADDQAIRVLLAMFRLTRFYGADISIGGPLGQDALTLLRATKKLLSEWDYQRARPKLATVFAQQIKWFDQQEQKPASGSDTSPTTDTVELANVQRGLLSPFATPASDNDVTLGAMLLLRIRGRDGARADLAGFTPTAEGDSAPPADGIFRTIAFTRTGLERIGVPKDAIDALGDAFREGAAARAGLLGDTRSFHPEKWQMPARNWPADAEGAVPLETVDVVIMLRITAPSTAPHNPFDPEHPLQAAINAIGGWQGLDLMHVEGLGQADPGNRGVDHLGFSDGVSQPALKAKPAQSWSDKVRPDSLLIRDAADPLKLFRDGSYLAIRKIEIHANRLDTLVERAADEASLPQKLVRAKLMGREVDGTPLVPHTSKNDFDYAEDPKGERCPLQSHVRRVNPRTLGQPAPRIMRRGMSFGPPVGTSLGTPRGSMFMATCGNLAEQYEILLRWVNGGNSSRLGSWAADPLIGPALAGDRRIFAFPHAGRVCRVPIDDAGLPVTQLNWSLYAIVTPIDFLDRLAKFEPAKVADIDTPEKRGARIVAYLQSLPETAQQDAWTAALRDPGAERAGAVDDLWAYIRSSCPSGILEIPVGFEEPDSADKPAVSEKPASSERPVAYLVSKLDVALEVLRDNGSRFSVKGTGQRLSNTIGNIHLGFDAYTDEYKTESPTINDALRGIGENDRHGGISEADAFDAFRTASIQRLKMLLATRGAEPFDLIGDLLEPVVSMTFPAWFGLPDGTFVKAGSQNWHDVDGPTPSLPGNYWNTARYAFIPTPSTETKRLALLESKALHKAATAWVVHNGRNNLPGTVANKIGKNASAYTDPEDVARVLTGTIMGAIATTLGNAARVIDSLAQKGDLQRLAFDWRAGGGMDVHAARKLFGITMENTIQSRPVPELMWRTVVGDGQTLGGVALKKDAPLIIGTDSAAVEERAAEQGAYIAFGMSPDAKKPTAHGCPGRDMAMGMILGWLAGLSEAATIRWGGSRFTLALSPLK
jgi:hypothetical protein